MRRFGVDAIISHWWWRWRRNVSFSLSLCISISPLRLYTFFSRSHLVYKFSLKMRVSSKELFSTLKNFMNIVLAILTGYNCFHLPAHVFFFTLHSHFNPIVDSQHTSPHHVSPNLKLPLASSVKQGNDTKYKTGGLYMIYRVTELLKIHAKFSGVSVEMFVWIFWVMCSLCYFLFF